MSTTAPSSQEVMDAILTGIYATSLACVRAVQEAQKSAFGETPEGTRDITLAGGLAATAAQSASAARDLAQTYATLKGLPADPPPA